jgi:hypothetical protein
MKKKKFFYEIFNFFFEKFNRGELLFEEFKEGKKKNCFF